MPTDRPDLDLTHWWALPYLAGLVLLALPLLVWADVRGR